MTVFLLFDVIDQEYTLSSLPNFFFEFVCCAWTCFQFFNFLQKCLQWDFLTNWQQIRKQVNLFVICLVLNVISLHWKRFVGFVVLYVFVFQWSSFKILHFHLNHSSLLPFAFIYVCTHSFAAERSSLFWDNKRWLIMDYESCMHRYSQIKEKLQSIKLWKCCFLSD